MKFEDYKEVMTDEYGYQFVKNGVMVGTDKKSCLVCGYPTKYIEVCSEAHFCSDECVNKFNKQVAEFERIGDEFQEEIKRISTMYQITETVAGCYLSNYDTDNICHNYKGKCRSIEQCNKIYEKEKSE